MKRVRGCFGLLTVFYLFSLFSIFLIPVKTYAASSVLITEISCGSKESASEEYIQITNISSTSVDITGWKLEYFSANPKDFNSPSRTINLSGNIASGSDYIAATVGNKQVSSDITFSSTLAASGGHLRLKNKDGMQVDFVGWGTAVRPLVASAPAPNAGELIARKINDSNEHINSGSNSNDFEISQNISSGSRVVEANNSLAPLEISELLPNPASPVTDVTGEYIELYNPNSVDIVLVGYKLLTGISLNHSFVFKDQVIAANSYKAFYIGETKLTLSNTAGKAQLQDKSGQVISETTEYSSAPDGQSWVKDGDNWVWSSQPTPNAVNVISAAVTQEKESTTSKTTTSKPKTTKSSSKAKTEKSTKEPKAGSVLASETSQPAKAALNYGILAGVGGLALLYGGYEYRQDIINFYHKLKRNRKAR